ncbi:hypothetical protein ACQCVP_00265 [Rossellomorea vietnamensis]|uniref:hypothetical protein n=1 Tax=Rossellomorea vietnamensis TaxID=218284 RepID=UPI003CF15908
MKRGKKIKALLARQLFHMVLLSDIPNTKIIYLSSARVADKGIAAQLWWYF